MGIFGRIVRRTAVRVIRPLANRRAILAITLIAVIGLGGSVLYGSQASKLSFLPSSSGSSASGGSSSDQTVANGYERSSNEPQATYDFIRGQQVYDAKLVWGGYSDRALQALQSQGDTVDALQQQLDRSKQLGAQIQKAQFVGSYPVPNGGSMDFYVVTRTGRTRGDVSYVPYVFTLDSSGKIDNVE